MIELLEPLVSWKYLGGVSPGFAALVAATLTTVVAVTSLGVNFVIESGRRKSDRERDADQRAHDRVMEREKVLREAASAFSATAVEEVDLAEMIMGGSQSSAPSKQLVSIHTRLRTQYEALLLISRSPEAQVAARAVLRLAWNERAEALGRERQRPRPDGVAPSKHLRAELRTFTKAIREELGLDGELVDEPLD